MATNSAHKLDQIDVSTTARINRRQTVMAQIEAALLANKLAVLEFKKEQQAGSDPYNSFRTADTAWDRQSR